MTTRRMTLGPANATLSAAPLNLGSVVPGRRLRSIGWLALIGLCFALLMVLSFRVNALKSEVRMAENRIVSLKREKLYLETEFETRASQQQLKAWNDVEFGYVAPGSSQYLENERQLAALGRMPGPDAPRPIRVASADDAVVAAAAFPQMVSPLTGDLLGGEKEAGEKAKAKPVDRAAAAASLGERLGKVEGAKPTAAASTKTASKDEAKAKAKAAPKKADAKSERTLQSQVRRPAEARKAATAQPTRPVIRNLAATAPARSRTGAEQRTASSRSPAKTSTAKTASAKTSSERGSSAAKKEARR